MAVVVASLAWIGRAPALAQDENERRCELAGHEVVGRFAICKARALRADSGDEPSAERDAALTKCAERFAARWEEVATDPRFRGTECAASTLDSRKNVLVELCSDRIAGLIERSDERPVPGIDPVSGIAGGLDTASVVSGVETAATTLGDATPARVLKGVVFSSSASSAGTAVLGSMSNAGAVLLQPGLFDAPIPKGYHNGWGRCVGDVDLKAGNILRGVGLFSVTGSLTGGQLPQTGQRSCFASSEALIPCAGSGQDGEQLRGWSRNFTDNGNGTITDGRTSLVWEKLSDDGGIHDWDSRYTFSAAMTAKIAALNASVFGGFSDWRLPNRFELATIVNLDRSMPATFDAFQAGCVPGCSVTSCSCTRSELYWSSSSYLNEASNAWLVYFAAGGTGGDAKTKSYHVRAVRGG